MERGELVPDDVVVAIIAERIDQPDAKRGFVLDGFPRTVPQAEALNRLLAVRGLKLDAVIELKVDEDRLLQRIEKRVAEMAARGEKVRADDNPEVLRGRLSAYRAQTAPLAEHYAAQGMLRRLDGMATIDEVTDAIDRLLSSSRRAAQKGAAKSGSRKGKRAKTGRRNASKGPSRRKRSGGAKGRKNKPGQRKNGRRRLTRAR